MYKPACYSGVRSLPINKENHVNMSLYTYWSISVPFIDCVLLQHLLSKPDLFLSLLSGREGLAPSRLWLKKSLEYPHREVRLALLERRQILKANPITKIFLSNSIQDSLKSKTN